MAVARRQLRLILLLLLVSGAIALVWTTWLEQNPYRSLRAEDVKAICLCELNQDFSKLKIVHRIEDTQCIRDVVEAICRPNLKQVCYVFGAFPKPVVFFGKDESVLLGVWYHPDEVCVSFRKLLARDGEVHDTGYLRYRAVLGNEIEKLIVGYLDKHKLSKSLFYGDVRDLRTGKPVY